jgi:hypothetical protein
MVWQFLGFYQNLLKLWCKKICWLLGKKIAGGASEVGFLLPVAVVQCHTLWLRRWTSVDVVVCVTGQVIVMQNYGGQQNEVLHLRSVTMLSGTSQTVMETFVVWYRWHLFCQWGTVTQLHHLRCLVFPFIPALRVAHNGSVASGLDLEIYEPAAAEPLLCITIKF